MINLQHQCETAIHLLAELSHLASPQDRARIEKVLRTFVETFPGRFELSTAGNGGFLIESTLPRPAILPIPDDPAPVAPARFRVGMWVARYLEDDDKPAIGLVREVHANGQLDIIRYAPNGKRLGRVTFAADGITEYEPQQSPHAWSPIETPPFEKLAATEFYGRYLRALTPPR